MAAPAPTVRVELDRESAVYKPNDTITGKVVVQSDNVFPFGSVILTGHGQTQLELSATGTGLFEAFYSAVKPVQLFKYHKQLSGKGQLDRDSPSMEFPFEIQLTNNPACALQETYHGKRIQTRYKLAVEVTRSVFTKSLVCEKRIYVHTPVPQDRIPTTIASTFSITPSSLENVDEAILERLPDFRISGSISNTKVDLGKSIVGEVVIEKLDAPVQWINFELLRVESIQYTDGITSEASVIENIQLADGDVCRGMSIPIHFATPKWEMCPTTHIPSRYSVTFECAIVVAFAEDYIISESFKITTYRS